MSTIVTVKAVGMVETNRDNILAINTPLVTIKPTVIPPFGCKQVNGLAGCLPAHSYHVHVVTEPIENHSIMQGVMATSTYEDLCPWLSKKVILNKYANVFAKMILI